MLSLGVSGLLGDPMGLQGWIGDQEAAEAWVHVVSGLSGPGPATQLSSPPLTRAETEIYSSHSLQMSYLQGTQASSTVLSSRPNSCPFCTSCSATVSHILTSHLFTCSSH